MSFQTLFLQSRGKPIVYKGNTLAMVDFFPVEDIASFVLTFEAISSEWRQGVYLRSNGVFLINGKQFSHAVPVWYDTAPRSYEFEIIGNIQSIEVRNIWDVGDGVMHSWHNGAAMIVDEIDGGGPQRSAVHLRGIGVGIGSGCTVGAGDRAIRRWIVAVPSEGTRQIVGDHRHIESEGVIGKKPVLKPGETHTYNSGCLLASPFGAMRGYFNMINFTTTKNFRVIVPSFRLSAPFALN